MALPFISAIAALSSGGILVPHAAGGFIVTTAIGGYVAGTYLSTAATTALLASAGFFGTTVGATGIKGTLMAAGVISSTPFWVAIAGISAVLLVGGSSGYLIHSIYHLKQKCEKVALSQEAQFSEADVKIVGDSKNGF